VDEQLVEYEHRVTPLELFFDLVFVFALTQVTTLLSEDATWGGLGRAVLVLAALWWAWASYAWLTNTIDPEEGATGAAVLVAMAAMFVAALAVPDAFGRHGVVFGVAFLIVCVMQISLFALAGRGNPDLLGAVLRIAPSSLVAAALILAAGFVETGLRPVLWLAGLVTGYFVPLFVAMSGWHVRPAHFAERHGLILIIALGESFVAIGLGARGTGLGSGVIVAAVVGLVVATSFWLAYFDFFSIRVQQLLADRSGAQRIVVARDVYTYLHLPMVAGIVLFAFAMKQTLAHVGDELGTTAAFGLCFGSALYLGAYVAVGLRIARRLSRGRLVAAVVFALLLPVAVVVPALVALTLVAVVWVVLHGYEIIWWWAARASTRAQRVTASAS
jgi:low temperature requirement protein LtrA